MQQERLLSLDPSDIKIVKNRNTRFDLGDLEELANSIAAQGIRNPIKVQKRGNIYYLVEGHRRWEACALLKHRYKTLSSKPPTVENGSPVFNLIARLISSDATEDEITIDMLVSNDGKPFLPLEEALMLDKLKKSGQSNAEIAKQIGKSISHVSDRLSLVNADETVKKAVEEKKITASEAVTITRKTKGDKEKQQEIMEKVEKEGKQVIEKELKAGRMPKHHWEATENMYDDFYASTTHPMISNGFEQIDGEVEAMVKHIEETPDLDIAFQAGMMAAVAKLVNMELLAFLNKVHERKTGVGDWYK